MALLFIDYGFILVILFKPQKFMKHKNYFDKINLSWNFINKLEQLSKFS